MCVCPSSDASKVSESVLRKANARLAQLLGSVREMRCVVVEEPVLSNPLHGKSLIFKC
jgi:hypothetical protein